MRVKELNPEKMSQEYYDVLKELGNIGAGNATTALAQMLQCRIDMTVPQVRLLTLQEMSAVMGGEEQIMVGIYLAVEGDVTGSMMFLTKKDTAKHLVNKLMQMDTGADFSDMDISALKEIGNIITGAYLNALSMITNLSIYPSVPDLTIDMAGAILSVPAIEFGTIGDQILLIQTQFSDEVALDGFFILIPDVESYQKILNSLGIQ
ncbi:MAG: chemotaxis protein CheC [Lachnospiraceae bacterium]|nr:chemotaxis protein CheC [Lachnospiraceae bacterium]